MPNYQSLRAADGLVGPSRFHGALQLPSSSSASLTRKAGWQPLHPQDKASPNLAASQHQPLERQHASASSSKASGTSRKHISEPSALEERLHPEEQLHPNSSPGFPCMEQADDRPRQLNDRKRQATEARYWCWQWANTRWRASFFFLMASVAFVFGSGASLQQHLLAGSRPLARLFMEWPFALGSLSYLIGAHLYKKGALEGYTLQRRMKGRLAPVLKWARVEVIGTGMIVLGCQLGSISSGAPLVLQALPSSIAQAPLMLLETWLATALNTVAGALFVVGSYTILAGMYSSFAPQQVLSGPHTSTLNFWGSASYLLGSCGLLIGAVFAQPVFAVHPVVKYWLGQVIGYFIGSIWFIIGAFAQIADVARELHASEEKLM